MPTDFDAVATGIVTNSQRLAFQPSGDSRLLLVLAVGFNFFGGPVFYENPTGGENLGGATFLVGDSLPSGAGVNAFYALAPPAVEFFLGPDGSFEGDAVLFAVISFKNAEQVEPSFDIATGTGTAPSIDIASAVDNLVLGLLGLDLTSITGSPGAGETERFDDSFPEDESSVNTLSMAGYEQAGAALVSLTPTLSASADWVFIGLNLGVAPPLLTFPFLLPFERGQAFSPTFNLPFERDGAIHGFSLPFERSAIVKPTMHLPFERRLLPLLSESATIVDSRRILAQFSARLLDERTIIPAAPPLASFMDTRSIFRAFLPFIDSRTIVPRSVILNSGLAESGEAQGGTLTTVILAPDASSTNGFYVGMWITIDGDERKITAYNGTTKTATVASLSGTPIAGTPYSITIAKPGASKVLRPFAEVTES
jgi:hypothetical protein